MSQQSKQGRDLPSSLRLSLKNLLFLAVVGSQVLRPQLVVSDWKVWPLPESLQKKRFRPGLIASNQFRDLYLVDRENYWLVAIPGDGRAPRLAGGWGVSGDLFSEPTDIVASPGLDVLLCDNATHRILRFDRMLNFIADLALNAMTPVATDYPSQIGKNRWGEVVVSSSSDGGVSLLSPDQPFVTLIGSDLYGTDRFVEISDLEVNEEGDVALIDGGESALVILNRQGGLKQKVPFGPWESELVGWWEGRWLLLESDGTIHELFSDRGSFRRVPGQLKPGRKNRFTDFTIVEKTLYAVDDLAGEIFTAELSILE